MIKKNHPHVYLEECKYRIKKTQMSRSKFINTELKSDSDSDLDDNELMAKLKRSDSDSEWKNTLKILKKSIFTILKTVSLVW